MKKAALTLQTANVLAKGVAHKNTYCEVYSPENSKDGHDTKEQLKLLHNALPLRLL